MDLEKIAETVSRTVQTVNIAETINQTYNIDSRSQTATVAQPALLVGADNDPLRLILGDDDLYREVVERLHTCEKAEQVKTWVCQYIRKNHKHGDEITVGGGFVSAILPHLTQYTQSKNAKTLQNALL